MRKTLRPILAVMAILLFFPTLVQAETTVLRGDRNLTAADGISPDGRPEFVYHVSAGAGERITIRVSSLDFEPMIRIISNGTETISEAQRGMAVLSTRVHNAGEVAVAITSRPNSPAESGHYSIRIDLYEPEQPIQPGEVRHGVLGHTSDRYDGTRYIDWYDLHVQRGETYLVMVESLQIDTYLVIQFPDGTELVNDDYIGTDAGLLFTASLTGTVRLGATSYMSGELGEYRVRTLVMDPPRVIELGSTVEGTLRDDLGPEARSSIYRLSGYEGLTVRITLESDEFDTVLSIQNTDGYFDENDDAPGLGTNSRLFYTFTSGTPLEIIVTGFYGDVGSYQLRVEEFTPPAQAGPIPDGEILLPGEAVYGFLNTDSGAWRSRTAQRFTFETEENTEILIDLVSDSFDAYLVLIAPSGQEFIDDDGGYGTDSRLAMPAPESGLYQVYATSYSGYETGSYTVTLELSDPMTMILSIDGYLSSDAPRSSRGHLFRTYNFSGEAGERIVLELLSQDFDTYLELQDPSGRVIAENDDYGGSSNSRIDATLPVSGRYTAVVRGFRTDPTGRFQLLVRK